jgi:hypothetical protein
VTDGSFDPMSEQEQRALARQLADSSNVLDFEAALEIVQLIPEKAEKLLRDRAEHQKLLGALEQANQSLRRAAREFR